MQKKHFSGVGYGFILYMLLVTFWILPIIAAPFLELQQYPIASPIYAAYGSAFVCHQLNSRSLCYFPKTNYVEDCTQDSSTLQLVKTPKVSKGGDEGYKFPVCARDIGVYGAMFLGGILALLLGKAGTKEWPSPWILVVLCIPMAIDGGTQALGFRESSNMLRLITGFIVGIALPFYFIPLLNTLMDGIFRKSNAKQ